MPILNSEKDVKREVKKLLDKHKWFWFSPPSNAYGKSGIADILALRGGVFLAVETKFGKNNPTPMQTGFLNSIQAERGLAFVVNEHTIRSLEIWLRAFDAAAERIGMGGKVEPADGAAMLDAIKAMTEAFA